MRRWILGPVLCALLAGSAASCGPTQGASRGSSTTSTTLSVDAPMRVSFGSGAIGAPNSATTYPSNNGRPIVSAPAAAGQNIVITPEGFEPRNLEASVTAPVVWTNLSGGPQRIVFQSIPVDSGTIPPGGTFRWTPGGALALEYRSPSGWYGVLEVNQSQL